MIMKSELIEHLGSAAALARASGVIRRAAVWQWPEQIPPERVLPIMRAVNGNIMPHELRPDVYPDSSWLPPDTNQDKTVIYQDLCMANS